MIFNLLVRVREPVEERERRMVKEVARRELIIVTAESCWFLTDWNLKQVFVSSKFKMSIGPLVGRVVGAGVA